jgi:hypothetical protein
VSKTFSGKRVVKALPTTTHNNLLSLTTLLSMRESAILPREIIVTSISHGVYPVKLEIYFNGAEFQNPQCEDLCPNSICFFRVLRGYSS